MASNSFVERLRTFHSTLPQNFVSSLSNTPVKFAEAGWERVSNVPHTSDELICRSCSVRHSGWSGESPLAVHRIKSPNCPFLNTPPSIPTHHVDNHSTASSTSSSCCDYEANHEELEQPTTLFSIFNSSDTNNSETLKRKLFFRPNINHGHSLRKYGRHQTIIHPFKPLTGGYPMLFESLRYTTYNIPSSVEAAAAAKWSEEGFVMISNVKAQCVYCGIQLEFDVHADIGHLHWQKSPECPFVCHFDVGNISSEMQRKILENGRSKHFDFVNICGSYSLNYSVKHPEFEKSSDRSGTFTSWPKLQRAMFPPSLMADAGFYYTGHNDMVRCYSCGVELFDWTPGVTPETQHALASPSCFFLQQTKGQEFIDNAKQHELVVGVKEDSQTTDNMEAATSSTTETTATPSPSSSSTQSSSPSPSGLRPYLDLDGIAAARARGYSTEQISDAIITFLYLSCGYLPDSPLLLGLLKAGTDHHKTLCDKTQENLDKNKEIQVKDKEIHVIKTEAETAKSEVHAVKSENQVIKSEVQAKDQELQRQRFERQWRELAMKTELEQALQQKDLVIAELKEDSEEKDQALEEKDQVINNKDLQLSILQQELEEIRQRLRPRSAPLDRSGIDMEDQSEDPDVRESQNSSRNGDINLESCQMCLDAPMQILLRPCKHLCCCALCVTKLDGRCPICRRITTDMEKVYVS